MPESVEMPAPVSTTTRRAWRSRARAPRGLRSRQEAGLARVGFGHDEPCWHARRAGGGGPTVPPCPRPGPPPSKSSRPADAEARQRRAAGALLARGCTRGDRVAFALGSSADLICAVLGAARVGPDPGAAQRHPDRDRARTAGRGRRSRPTHLRPGRPGRPGRGAAGRAGPLSADPAHALHLGHHGPTQGRDHRPVGRGDGPGRLRGRGRGLAVRPRRSPPRVLADVPHRLHPLLGRHAALGRARWPS